LLKSTNTGDVIRAIRFPDLSRISMKNLDWECHNVNLQAGLYHCMVEEGDAPRFTTNELVEVGET